MVWCMGLRCTWYLQGAGGAFCCGLCVAYAHHVSPDSHAHCLVVLHLLPNPPPTTFLPHPQLWRISDMLYRPEEEALAELEEHR